MCNSFKVKFGLNILGQKTTFNIPIQKLSQNLT